MGTLAGVLWQGGAQAGAAGGGGTVAAAVVVVAAVAQVRHAGLNKGVHVKKVLAADEGGLWQKLHAAVRLRVRAR